MERELKNPFRFLLQQNPQSLKFTVISHEKVPPKTEEAKGGNWGVPLKCQISTAEVPNQDTEIIMKRDKRENDLLSSKVSIIHNMRNLYA